nr:hypothetical protein [Tanacetum cinerariifolium]
MSEYRCFPFRSGASILKGPALTSQDRVPQHTFYPLPEDQNIPEKTNHQRRVEVEDLKIVAIQERKERAAAKKKERKKQGAESREDRSPHASPRDSANRFMQNYSDNHPAEETDDLNLGSSGEQSGRALTLVNTEVIQPSLKRQRVNRGPTINRVATPLTIATQGANAEAGEELMVNLAPPAAQEESNALNNARVLERAWFSLARGSLAQTDILKRFENLQTDFDRLVESHAECGDLAGKFVQARLDLTHISHLYTSLSDWHNALKNEHEGCAGKLKGLENRNRELSQANRDQVLRIKELKDALAQKDLPLFMLRGLTPNMLNKRKNWFLKLDEQRWKNSIGLFDERSEEDLLELMGRMEGFDVHADTKMRVEYDMLFERRYPYVEKISRGFCHFVSDLLKVYLDFPLMNKFLPTSLH